MEDDNSGLWEDWTSDQKDDFYSDLPVGETGTEVVRLGVSRPGGLYS